MDVNKRIGEGTLAASGRSRAVQEALEGLRPPSRAVLDLVYNQHLPPAEVSRISGVDESSVDEWRATALEELAIALNVSGPEFAASMLERAANSPPEAREAAPEARRPERSHRPASKNRRSLRIVVLASIVAVMLAVSALAIALSGGEDDEAVPAPSASAPSEEPRADEGAQKPEAPPGTTKLSPLPGAPGTASIAVAPAGAGTQVVELKLSGLPQTGERYEAWLYTSILDSISLGSIDSGDGTIEAELPANARDFEFLDVSIQGDRDEAHSGRSIFRAPTEVLDGER